MHRTRLSKIVRRRSGVSTAMILVVVVVVIIIVAAGAFYYFAQGTTTTTTSSSSQSTTTSSSSSTTTSSSSSTTTTITSSSSSKLKIAYIASGPCNDLGYYEGGCVAVKNMSNIATIGIADSVADANYYSVAKQFADQGYNIIFGQGFEAIGPFAQLAPNYPNTLFAAAALGFQSNNSNFVGYYADNHESAYLGGVLAAYMTKTYKLGFISGLPIPAVWAYDNGFRMGAWSVNKSLQITSVFTQDFNDPSKAFQAATSLYQQGADFLYVGESPGGTGAYQVASQNHIYAMGNEFDQNPLANTTIVTSAVAIWYPVMNQIVHDYLNHNWKPTYTCGMVQGCADIASFHGLVPSSIAAKVNAVRAEILNGTLVVPLVADHEVTSPP